MFIEIYALRYLTFIFLMSCNVTDTIIKICKHTNNMFRKKILLYFTLKLFFKVLIKF